MLAEDESVLTLREYLEQQRQLELEAAAALPYKFDQCTFRFGPIKQNLHICHGCPAADQKAYCYSCAVSCHNFSPDSPDENASESKHKIEEIWARRSFLCECPSTGKCTLVKPEEYELSPHASYTNPRHREHNFVGKYCYCDGQGWSAGDRTMYQCECCEDWFHDDCVAKRREGVQIPAEDSFEDFICDLCVEEHQEFFSKVSCSEMIYCSPPMQNPVSASIFLHGAWRLELQRACQSNPELTALLTSHKLTHLLAEEAVYNPEDEEAKESLYERKNAKLKQFLIL